MSFLNAIKAGRLYFDGAMGTMLQNLGLQQGELPESWNITHPEIIEKIHTSYIEAGCDILITNTVGANAIKLKTTPYSVEELMTAAIKIAKSAAEKSDKKVFVAADICPTGKLLKPLGDLSFEEACAVFAQIAKAAKKAGADLILIETMSDSYELKAAVLAAKENTDLPVVTTIMSDENGIMLSGTPIEACAAMLEGLGVDALGLNCGIGPDEMLPLAKRLEKACSLPLAFNPNAGLPHGDEHGCTSYDISPDNFANSLEKLAPYASLLGGCCGTTPEHIKKMYEKCKNIAAPAEREFDDTVVCSGMQSVTLKKGAKIIGERINPTGKPMFKQALRDKNIDYILREGVAQQQNGAHILDVNVGLPEIDEPAIMSEAVTALQSVVPLPIQIDSSDPITIERALRIVNGKPLINSVNGKVSSMEAFFPLVKKYGGVVVALTLDENGIPETAQGRFEIAKKIVETAEGYGILRRDILVDVLTMTVSTGLSAKATLDALEMVKNKLHVGTVLGVSNISFGLPSREKANAAFLSMALEKGLDAAIMNPNSKAMTDAFYSSEALLGYDKNCQKYIEVFSNEAKPAVQNTAKMTLKEAVEKGLSSAAADAAKELLKTVKPMDIVEKELITALDKVGTEFENKTKFLPQLLMSADAAQAAFNVIRTYIAFVGGAPVKSGKIVLATVKGDIHDIGKNIVKVLLDNYGFDVIDLGKDVPPEKIVEAAKKSKVKLVGLSALMTTTVPSMAETIKQLKASCPDCKTAVGGAVLTKEYADLIGADCYARDAMDTVAYAKKIFGRE